MKGLHFVTEDWFKGGGRKGESISLLLPVFLPFCAPGGGPACRKIASSYLKNVSPCWLKHFNIACFVKITLDRRNIMLS